eukprot:Hpha_TRINITY_DN3780_c0_g1::TRINITY_DN3780_c0_g1_i1::g.23768::m.23768
MGNKQSKDDLKFRAGDWIDPATFPEDKIAEVESVVRDSIIEHIPKDKKMDPECLKTAMKAATEGLKKKCPNVKPQAEENESFDWKVTIEIGEDRCELGKVKDFAYFSIGWYDITVSPTAF